AFVAGLALAVRLRLAGLALALGRRIALGCELARFALLRPRLLHPVTQQRVLGIRPRQEGSNADEGGEQDAAGGEPGAGHGGGHLEAALPQVPAQPEEARRQQQADAAGKVDRHEPEGVTAALRRRQRDERLAQPEDWQSRQGEIDDPDAECPALALLVA